MNFQLIVFTPTYPCGCYHVLTMTCPRDCLVYKAHCTGVCPNVSADEPQYSHPQRTGCWSLWSPVLLAGLLRGVSFYSSFSACKSLAILLLAPWILAMGSILISHQILLLARQLLSRPVHHSVHPFLVSPISLCP